ncbi:hypothetical protein CEXT_320181 [Caerostris extrusa]|uniref:Uncharacterized protein n=1 Tax=Caerostris extrusa TaxID=172846 RepID=A0AAV4X100_CAEEX|nr:hypothetical protein CEXT_320181 [Caerostris extrusa]
MHSLVTTAENGPFDTTLWWSGQANISSWSSVCPLADLILRGGIFPGRCMAGLNWRKGDMAQWYRGKGGLQTDLYACESFNVSLRCV